MAGFEGFEEVRREFQRSWRDGLVNMAIRVDSSETVGTHDYVVGRDVSNGRRVRAVLADRRGYDGRPSLPQRVLEAGPDGIMVLIDCHRNRNGTFEAFNALPFPASAPVLVDGVARVSVPWMRREGGWRQSVQHLRTDQAVSCDSYMTLVDAVLAALSKDGPGRAGAIVRGWHIERGGAMGFEIGRIFDPDVRDYLDAEMSFDAFLASPDVFVGGLGTSATGDHCMGIVSRLMDECPERIIWEVIPKRTYSLGGAVATAAGLGTGRDPSRSYRMNAMSVESRATGCLPSIIAFAERDGVFWPRLAVPFRIGEPVPEVRISTASVFSVCHHRVSASGPQARGERGLTRSTRPMSAELLAVAAAGPGSPDLGGLDGTVNEDVAAFSRTGESLAPGGAMFGLG